MAKARHLREESTGYERAVKELDSEYENEYDRALSQISFEQYQALNEDLPESVNRQAHDQLREEFGVQDEAPTQAEPPSASQAPVTETEPQRQPDTNEGAATDKPEQEKQPTETTPTQGSPKEKPARAAASNGTNKPAKPIEDFGEKIGGARKDTWTGFRESLGKATPEVLVAEPLSKVMPKPDYVKLAKEGMEPDTLAALAILRESVEPKPRKQHYLSSWAMRTNDTAEAINDLMDGKISAKSAVDSLGNNYEHEHTDRLFSVLSKLPPEKLAEAARYRFDYTKLLSRDGKKLDVPEDAYLVTTVDSRRKGVFSSPLNGYHASLDDAVASLPSLIDKSTGSKPKKGVKLGVYQDRYTKEVFVGWKGAKDVLKIQTFDSTKEAREALERNRDKLEAILERRKATPNMRRASNQERTGVSRRKGNVTPEQFGEAFGFRGVEFGNWVEQERRQKDLNDAYDALMDLSELMNIPPKAISLNGELGLAFGARGKGGKESAKAHYEPNKVVINLTKKAGAGSLAHEWWHALDNYFGKQRANGGYVSDSPYAAETDAIRQEMVQAFSNVKKAIDDGYMRYRSERLDQRRTKAYYSTYVEMSARAFESFIIDKAEQQGLSNDYLANIVDEEAWNHVEEDQNTYPYPTESEKASINKAYQAFIDTIKHEETDKGTRLYSRQPEVTSTEANQVTKNAQGMKVSQAEKAAGEFVESLDGAGGIKVEVFATALDAEKAWNTSLKGANVKGAYDANAKTAYVIAENLDGEADLKRTLMHEVLAHGGLDTVISKEDYRAFLDRIRRTRNKKLFGSRWKEVDELYGDLDEDGKAEELFANFVGNPPERAEPKLWWNTIKTWLREKLEKFGLFSDQGSRDMSAMDEMVRSIKQGFKSQQANSGNRTDPAFSRTIDKRDADRYRADLARTMQSKRTITEPIRVGETPDVMVRFGAPKLDLYISKDTVLKATNGVKHAVPMPVIEQLPEHLSDPIAIFKSKSEGKVVLIDALDENKNPVIVAIHMEQKGRRGLMVNRIASVYGKDNARQTLSTFEMEYLNESKNPELVRYNRLQLPKDGSPSRGSGETVLTKADLVNENPNIRFSRQPESAATRKAKDNAIKAAVRKALRRNENSRFEPSRKAEWQPINDRLRETDKTAAYRIKKALGRWLLPNGNMPETVAKAVRERDSAVRVHEFDVSMLVSKLNAQMKANKVNADKLSDADWQKYHDYLVGESDGKAIPIQERQVLDLMREHIDGLTRDYVSAVERQIDQKLLEMSADSQIEEERAKARKKKAEAARNSIQGKQKRAYENEIRNPAKTDEEKAAAKAKKAQLAEDLKAAQQELDDANKALESASRERVEIEREAKRLKGIESNLGKYMNRSYRAFDDKHWFKRIPTKVIDDAMEFFIKQNMENGDIDLDEATRRAEVTLNKIVKTGTAYDSLGAFISESKLGAKDLSTLIRRKELPPEIRALLGEYIDPRVNYSKSVAKMSSLIANDKLLSEGFFHSLLLIVPQDHQAG